LAPPAGRKRKEARIELVGKTKISIDDLSSLLDFNNFLLAISFYILAKSEF
jgi:hypothetical protein